MTAVYDQKTEISQTIFQIIGFFHCHIKLKLTLMYVTNSYNNR